MSRIKNFIYINIYKKIMAYSMPVFYYLPIKKRSIVILRDWGVGYGCNPKYLSQYIIDNHLPYKITWVLNDYDSSMPHEIKQRKLSRIGAIYALSRAHVVISTFNYNLPVKKKEKQFFIFIPHGQAGAKPCLDEIPLKDDFRKMAMRYAAMQNLFVASSEYQAKDFVDYYWCRCEILKSGYPRNDIFFQNNDNFKTNIRKNIAIPEGYKIVFYAPTFRDNSDIGAYSIDLSRIIHTLEKKTGEKWMVIVRLHPNLRFWYKKPIISYSDIVRDMTDYPDVQELFLISDIVITDYSSTMFDFSLRRKPVFLFATDIDDYIEMRGLKEMFFKTPYPLCRNNEELEQAITNFKEDEYLSQLNAFYNVYKPFDDGHACQRIMKRIFDHVNSTII